MLFTERLVKVTTTLFDQLEGDPELARVLQASRSALQDWAQIAENREAAILCALLQAEAVLEAARNNGPEWMKNSFAAPHAEVRSILTLILSDRK